MSDASLAANVETVTGPGRATSGVQPGDRIAVLDVLRGVALLGMLIVHFNGRATLTGAGAGAGLDGAIDGAVDLFLTDRFYPMFGILFGVGFAVQLRRAEQRASRFAPMFLRRLLALAGFGFIAHGIFGYNVLIAYAIWGVPLLLVRNWSRGALMALLLACAASGPIRVIAIATYQSAVGHRDQFKVVMEKQAAQNRAAGAPLREAAKGTDFGRLVAERIRFLPHWYSRPFSYLPGGAFTLFLIGLLAFRSGLFDEPDRHRRLIVGAIAFGAASSVAGGCPDSAWGHWSGSGAVPRTSAGSRSGERNWLHRREWFRRGVRPNNDLLVKVSKSPKRTIVLAPQVETNLRRREIDALVAIAEPDPRVPRAARHR